MPQVIDATDLKCPMPLLKLKLALNKCSTGKPINLWVTDAASIKDIPAWAQNKGYQVLMRRIKGKTTEIIVTK